MNILIVGEFSGFAKHLKNGFKKLGHNVTIVMTPDSFKKFKGDKDDILYGYNISLLGRPIRGTALMLNPLRAKLIRKKLSRKYKQNKPDIIIVINYNFITTSRYDSGTPLSFLKEQVQRGSKLIMVCCGGDPAYTYTYPELLRQWGHGDRIGQLHDDRYSWLLQSSHVIIPMAVSYYDAIINYSNYEKYDTTKVVHSIPPPMTVDDKVTFDSCVGRKIVIFHGIVRPREKGTPFIQEAMNRLEAERPDKVECICRGGMPYDEYIKIYKSVDILVDQTYGRGFGMQSLTGAMKGKCVLVSNSDENNKDMGFDDVPFVQIKPDSEQIYQTLKDLVLNPARIDEIKTASRRFVENHCECSVVAKRYLNSVDF